MAQKPLGVALANSAGAQSPKISKGQLIAGILADALSGAAGQPGQFAAMMNRRQQQEQEEAQWGRRLEQSAQIKAKYDTPNPYRFQDNAGNVWERGADGVNKRIFTDLATKSFVHDGMKIDIPNPYAPQSSSPQSPPATIDESLWETGKPIGGQQANPLAGPFPNIGPYRRY